MYRFIFFVAFLLHFSYFGHYFMSSVRKTVFRWSLKTTFHGLLMMIFWINQLNSCHISSTDCNQTYKKIPVNSYVTLDKYRKTTISDSLILMIHRDISSLSEPSAMYCLECACKRLYLSINIWQVIFWKPCRLVLAVSSWSKMVI